MRRFLARLVCPFYCVALGPFGEMEYHTDACGKPNPY